MSNLDFRISMLRCTRMFLYIYSFVVEVLLLALTAVLLPWVILSLICYRKEKYARNKWYNPLFVLSKIHWYLVEKPVDSVENSIEDLKDTDSW